MITVFIVVGIIIVAGLVAIAVCYLWVRYHARPYIYEDGQTIPYRKTALLLGTAKLTSHGSSNRYFRYRIEAAEHLFNAKKCDTIIASGAGRHAGHHEADDMKAALVEAGIPATVIIADRAGYRTWDSLWRCRGSFGAHSFTVISQRFHIERAIFAGHKLGLNIIGLPAKDVHGKIAVRMFVRECLARVKCILDCYILHPKPVYMRRMRLRSRRRRRRAKKK